MWRKVVKKCVIENKSERVFYILRGYYILFYENLMKTIFYIDFTERLYETGSL